MMNDPLFNQPTAELRAQADRARDLANHLVPSDETGLRLRRLADELEAQAEALEQRRNSP
jgi:hypothetical protein